MKPTKKIEMFAGVEGFRPKREELEAVDGFALGDEFVMPELDFGETNSDLFADVGPVRAVDQLDGLGPLELMSKPRRITQTGGMAATHASNLAHQLHEAGEGTTRCILRGTFIFGDLIMEAAKLIGPCKAKIATLSYSMENVDALWTAFGEGALTGLDFVTSHFFYSHYRETLWRALVTNLPRKACRYAVAGTHAKVALLIPDDGSAPWCIEGSANLRSCQNLEQITVSIGDAEAVRFHAKWIDRILERFELSGRANLGNAATWAAVTGA